ncbi:MAG TPA: abortive infection system antitoxin AbiGi family protein [Prolixibacteraceae bacterium]|nr:abortive infection system antitoxin AbiGi family protein [Prolixibacteraceae bacterium]
MNNNTISANTLFHFTNSIENIKNILTHTFSPRYCLEHMDFPSNKNLDLGIPMVCFCDIPLSQIKDHVNVYGEYAIGLSKEWAMSNGISPVLYLCKDSITGEMIDRYFTTANKIDRLYESMNNVDGKFYEKTNIKRGGASSDYVQLIFFTKSYSGKMWKNGQLIENKTFYNEREWRFTPSMSKLESLGATPMIKKAQFDNEHERNELNNKINSIKIKFTPKDIKYIIVKKESERLKMIRMIDGIKRGTFSDDEIRELNSKIISVEQIREDF